MALTLEQFVSNLRRSGLLDASRLETVRAEVVDGRHSNPPALAASLLARGFLTSWQAEKLLAGVNKGFILGKYQLLRLIASGGMSTVYEAEHVHLHRRVALKVLPRSLAGDGSFLERFYREARAVAKLNHPNIIRGFDLGQEGDYHYLVMEFVEGSSLQQLTEENGRLPVDQAVEMIRQAALGLDHAHAAGLVHRDIKPANLLWDLKGTVKILDLGLVRSLQLESKDEAGLTRVHDEGMMGTVDYLSPEQAVNCHNVNIRSDIYSLGCTLYFLLAGTPPFPKGTLVEKLLAHQTKSPTPLSGPRPEIPPKLLQIVERMMAKRPEDRFQAPAEVADALGGWLRGCQTRPTVTVNEPRNSTPHSASHGRSTLVRKSGARTMVASPSQKTNVSALSSSSRLLPEGSAWSLCRPRRPVGVEDLTPRPLVECWRRWAVVVEALGPGRNFGPKVSDAAYRMIYHELLRACRCSWTEADESTRVILRKIEDLAAPWPTLRSLRSIMRSQLNESVLMQFDEIDQMLRGRRMPWLQQAFLILMVFGGGLGLIFSFLDSRSWLGH